MFTTIVYASNAKRVWDDFKERFDKSNLTRVYQLWTEVVSLKQSTDSVTAYYSKLRDLWDELDVLVPAPLCKCDESKPYIEHLNQQRLLIESYSHVRSDILLKEVVPTVNQAYATVIQEESQRLLGVMDVNKEPLTMMVNRRQGFIGRKLFDTACEHCDYKNHLAKDCYRVIGYPADFKSKKSKGKVTLMEAALVSKAMVTLRVVMVKLVIDPTISKMVQVLDLMPIVLPLKEKILDSILIQSYMKSQTQQYQ